MAEIKSLELKIEKAKKKKEDLEKSILQLQKDLKQQKEIEKNKAILMLGTDLYAFLEKQGIETPTKTESKQVIQFLKENQFSIIQNDEDSNEKIKENPTTDEDEME